MDFLELNTACSLLLFRDVARRLFVMNCETSECKSMLQHCSYVQWVPDTPDVAVAQSGGNLCVWYSAASFFLASVTGGGGGGKSYIRTLHPNPNT